MKSFTHRSTFQLALLIGALACLTTTGCSDAESDTSGNSSADGTTANTSTDSGDTSEKADNSELAASLAASNTSTDEPIGF